MFCQNCGASLEDGAKFCPNCGTPVAASVRPTVQPTGTEPRFEKTVYEQPAYEQPQAPVYEHPMYEQPAAPVYREPEATVVNEETNALGKATLIFGIIGLAFSLSFYMSFLGIIFSAIGRGKLKSYLASGGELAGKAKVGGILSKLGLIFGIILTAFFVIWLFVIIIGAVNGNYSTSNVHWYF